jgi:hypothetical protein
LKEGETPFEAMTYVSGNFFFERVDNFFKTYIYISAKSKEKQIFYCALLSAIYERKLSFQSNISIA